MYYVSYTKDGKNFDFMSLEAAGVALEIWNRKLTGKENISIKCDSIDASASIKETWKDIPVEQFIPRQYPVVKSTIGFNTIFTTSMKVTDICKMLKATPYEENQSSERKEFYGNALFSIMTLESMVVLNINKNSCIFISENDISGILTFAPHANITPEVNAYATVLATAVKEEPKIGEYSIPVAFSITDDSELD